MAGIEVPIIEQGEQEARYKELDQLDRELTGIESENTKSKEEKKTEILKFCKEETKKMLCNENFKEIGDWLDKIAETGINREARKKVWFKCAQQAYWNFEEFEKNKAMGKLETDDAMNISKTPCFVFFNTLLLLGENQSEISTWQKIWTKLNQTTENELLQRLVSFDDSKLTEEQVDLADEGLMLCNGQFHHDRFHTSIYSWCLNRVKTFRSKEKCTKCN